MLVNIRTFSRSIPMQRHRPFLLSDVLIIHNETADKMSSLLVSSRCDVFVVKNQYKIIHDLSNPVIGDHLE